MLPDQFASLDFARYQLKLRATQSVSLPAFLGSTLRGAFGHALKQAICVMPHGDCARCLVAERCIYPYLFETAAPPTGLLRNQSQAPRPFILAPPLLNTRSAATDSEPRTTLRAGDELCFGLLLMGRAAEYLPYVIFAVSEMARRGLGAARVPFQLCAVTFTDQVGDERTIYSGEAGRITVLKEATVNLADLLRQRLNQIAGDIALLDAVKVRFITPTRIRVDDDLQKETAFALLVRNLLRRISMLAAVHGRAPLELDYRSLIARASQVTMESARLRWHDWQRYSNRQQTRMKMGGFTGEVEYAGNGLQEFLPLLAAGELLHVGTGTTFGLGRYEIVPAESKAADRNGSPC
ncbi:MAG: CRISPR system precrRNA processing endoribonuclease RAMP protein Cas6 [Blastocatellia bacterium]